MSYAMEERRDTEPLIPLFGGKTGWRLVWAIVRGTVYWGLLVLVYTIAFVAGGALLGAGSFVAVGTLAGMEYTAAEMAATGLRNGGFFMVMWAPGLAMVICMIQARRRWERGVDR